MKKSITINFDLNDIQDKIAYEKKNTTTLAKYLLKRGIDSSLRIQKILFFLCVEEKRNKKDYGFFKPENNFQAWIYGPVNVESFNEMKKYFSHDEEAEEFDLSEEDFKQIDQIYGKWFEKYEFWTSTRLVDKSHKNIAWINARGDLDHNTPCQTFLKEDETFTQFVE